MILRIKKHIAQFPTQLLLAAIGILLFVPGIGDVHLFDWDEINFAESAREMLLTGNYRMVQINFEPFYEKPPLFILMQVLSMKMFGVNEFAARFPNAVCGVITLLVVFNAGRNVFQSQLGILWALLFAGSILPHLYFKSGIIDPFFNLFIFSGIFFLYKVTLRNDFENVKTAKRKRVVYLLLSGLFIGLATLTKGPVAILLTVLTASAYFFINRGKLKIEVGEMLIWWVVVALVVVSWLSFEIRANGMKFIDEFIRYQIRLFSTEDAGHRGPFFYHFLILLIGVFPASTLLIHAFRKNDYDDFNQELFKKWMLYLLLVVLLVFSIVKTKIIHYSSLCYFPITFFAAYYLNHLINRKVKWQWQQTFPLLLLGLLFTLALTAGVIAAIYSKDIIPMIEGKIKDPFALACLHASVYWSYADIIPGVIYLICLLVAVSLIQTRHLRWGVYLLLISSALFINVMMVYIVPRAEKYSQAALIEFLETKKGQHCVVETIGFKSYAHYFYTQRAAPAPNKKPCVMYLVTKVNKTEEVMKWHPNANELYRKNGWVFYEQKD